MMPELRRCLAAAVAMGGAVAFSACGAFGKRDTVAFDIRTGWRARGAAEMRADGRISLTRDGSGSVVKTVALDVDRFPMMLVRTAQSLPRLTWIVSVSAVGDTSRQVRLIEKYGEEGGYLVPLRATTGWHGKMRFDLTITIQGHRADWIEFGDVEAVRLTDAKPPSPRLGLPADRAVISAGALHYDWFQVPNAVSYELQVSRSRDFGDARSVRIAAPYLADKLPYLPRDEELLASGTWYWRVRGFNLADRAGDWSAPGSFAVREAVARPKPPELTISPAHPLIVLFGNPARLAENWRSVPAELRRYVVFRVEMLPSESLEAVVERAQHDGIPIVFQAAGPHDYYGRVSSRIPLTEAERLFQRFSVVKGVYICEQAFREAAGTKRIMTDFARRLIPLAAEYGKVVLWADGHWGRNLWIDVGLNRSLLDTIRAYPQHFVPMWKMNGALTPYTAHDALFGLWMSGAVANWGIQPERWYWYEAGLGALGRYGWFKEGDPAVMPPSYYGQMVLLGLSSGAAVYSFEPSDDIWGADSGLSAVARDVTMPLLSEIVSRHLIPTREDVGGKIRTVYLADSTDAVWALDYGSMRALYRGSYGVAHPFEMIPGTGRYYWIPILPEGTPPAVLARFPDRLRAAAVRDSAQVRRHLDVRYPRHGGGDAWVVPLGDGAVISNSAENGAGSQDFDVPLSGKVTRVSGRVDPNDYLVLEREPDGLRMHVNGRPGSARAYELVAGERPSRVEATPAAALAGWSYEPRTRRVLLDVRLSGQAVVLDIRFAGESRAAGQ